jgi:CubicO group peptidase (beta-lactamase class C family)
VAIEEMIRIAEGMTATRAYHDAAPPDDLLPPLSCYRFPMPSSRRRFIARSSHAALGLSLLPLASCSRSGERSDAPPEHPATPAPPPPAALVAEIERLAPALLAEMQVPGLSLALVSGGHLVWSRGFGVASSVSKAPVTAETLFEAGSVSKTVFAYAVMKLCEHGLLDLDTPLTTYVPERWIDNDPRFDRITARHVLSHTTGLPNWRSSEDPLRIAFEPGSKWQYSGEGYSYLQLVVAHRTGRVDLQACETMHDGLRVCATDIDAYLRTTLLRPFGMPSSGFIPEEALTDRLARPHDAKGAPIDRPKANAIAAARYGAAGGLVTTPSEYARFLIEVLDPKPSDAFRLTLESRDEMLRPQVKVADDVSHALGWQVLHWKSGDVVAHGGENPGFQAQMIASVPRKAGFLMMANGDRGFEVIGRLLRDTPVSAFVTG